VGDDIRAGERREGKSSSIHFLIHDLPNSTGPQLSSLQEKSTSSKLDMLYRRSLYVLPLNMARSQRLDESSVAVVWGPLLCEGRL
jgi:hypothetical protein